MAEFYGSHFEFNGVSSRNHGLIIVNMDTERYTNLYGEKESITIFNKGTNKRYYVDDNYSNSPISFDIEILNENERCFDIKEKREIEKWLFHNRGYHRLYMDAIDDSYGETYEIIDGKKHRNYLNCRFLNPKKIEYNGGIIGYKAQLEADSNMFWQDEITKKFVMDSISNYYTDSKGSKMKYVVINVDSDLDEYIYPFVKIKTRDGNEGETVMFHIYNNSEGLRSTGFNDVPINTNIIMNGELNYVSLDDSYKKGYECFTTRNFIRFLNGENVLLISSGISEIEFTYSVRRAM